MTLMSYSGASAAGGDPWGGITTSTIPDPWGGIGAVGVPSRASPLAFHSSSPPRAGSDPWGSGSGNMELANTSGSNDPWAAPSDLPSSVSPAMAKSMSMSPSPSTAVSTNACSSAFGTLPFFPYQHATDDPGTKMSVLSLAAADPFSPGDPNDVMSAFGGNGHNGGGGAFGGSPLHGTVSPTMGGQHTQSPNPWDLSGLDPMGGQTDLLGNNVGMVSKLQMSE